LAVLLLAGCAGQDGHSYQKYSWSGAPGYLYDTNPATPATVYNDTYYPTGEGKFYLEYMAWDGSLWWAYYTITVNKGRAILQEGDDLWFEIGLYSFGPSLYKWTSAYSLLPQAGEGKAPKSPSQTLTAAPGSEALSEGRRGEVLGRQDWVKPAGTVHLEFGRLLAK
jgi:hypothetical protein